MSVYFPPSQQEVLLSAGNGMIAVPKRATVADLVSSVVAAAAAQRETSSLSLVNAPAVSSGSLPTAASRLRRLQSSIPNAELPPEVVAKFPSHQGLWSVLRRAIAADPAGTQEPPLFLLRDSVTRDALTINQQYLKSLIESFELNGGARGLLRRNSTSGRRDAADNELDEGADAQYPGDGGTEDDGNREEYYDDDQSTTTAGQQQQQQHDAVGMGNSFAGSVSRATRSSLDPHRTPTAGSFARGLNESTLSTPTAAAAGGRQYRGEHQSVPPRGNRSEPKSSLVTVTVTSSTGLLRTFRASVQFWEHVLLQYHNLLESHRRWSSPNAATSDTRSGGARAAAAAAERDVAASISLTAEQLLRKAKQQEEDRIVLTVKVSSGTSIVGSRPGGAPHASRDAASPPPWWISGTDRTQPNTSSEVTPVVVEGDVELLSSLQVTVKEWRDMVQEWDRTTEPLVVSSRRVLPSALKRGGGSTTSSTPPHLFPTEDHERSRRDVTDGVEGAGPATPPHGEGSRPRRSAVIDPSTSGDLVEEARRRIHEMEARSTGSHSAFWTHFMKHWSVLEAQYRNYL